MKEQSDKSSGEESDTEESLCPADKSMTFVTCPVSNKLSTQQKKKCYKKKLNYKKVWKKVARMAKHVEQQNAMEMQCAGAARQAECHGNARCRCCQTS